MTLRALSRSAVFAAILCLGGTLALPAHSQDSDQERYVGEWRLIPSVPQGRRTIQSAFDHALRDANSLLRALARQMIDTNTMLPRRIVVAIDGSMIATTLHTQTPHRFRTRANHPTHVTTESDRDAQLTQLFRDGHLEMIFDMDEGRRWTVLDRDGDELTLTTTIDPERIENNVHYVLRYRRAQ